MFELGENPVVDDFLVCLGIEDILCGKDLGRDRGE